MPTNRRGMPANQLARDYGASLDEFANDVINLLGQIDSTRIAATPAEQCRESCAAVWSAMVAALESSSLTTRERERLTPLLRDALLPFWRGHCADEPGVPALLAARASHYLRHRDPDSQIKTAANLVNGLMERLGVAPDAQRALGKSLTALFAHRMLGDTHRLNDVRARFGIELPLLAALGAFLQVTMNYEPVLRLFRHV